MSVSVSDTTSSNAGSQTSDKSGDAHKREQALTGAHDENVSLASRRSKSDTKYWVQRLYKQVNSKGAESPHYSVKIQFQGRRSAFALFTGNREAAARRAMRLYQDVIDRGWDSVLEERRGLADDRRESSTIIITIGMWIESARSVFSGSPTTFAGYTRALRFIASEIVEMNKTTKRFEKAQSGEYRRKVDAYPISILTPPAIQAWKIGYVARNGVDPARARAARITANFTLRSAKSLFSKRIVKYSTLTLPDPLPFSDVEFYPRESMKYHSKIDAAALMQAASIELAESDPEAFKVLILALGVGLRRGEADRLLWRQIDCAAGIIHVETTEAGALKTPGSTGQVHIDETLSSVLQGFKAKASSEYVIGDEVEESSSSSWLRRYRSQGVFDRLIRWLRDYGIESRNPIHVLRKEAGSLIATQHGIYAASKFLRHADLQTTTMHYADLKQRTVIDMGALLQPRNVAELPTKAKKVSGS
jgi:integrase